MSTPELGAAEVQALGRRTITQLNNALRTLRIHEANNPSATAILESLGASMNALSDHFGAGLKLEFASNSVFINEVRIRVTAASIAQVQVLETELQARGVGGLTFQRPVRLDGLRSFLAVFARKPETVEEREQFLRQLVAVGRDAGVQLLEARTLVSEEEAAEVAGDPKQNAIDVFSRLVVAFDAFITALEDGQDPLEGRLVMVRLVQDLVDLSGERVDALLSLPLLRRASQAAFERAAPRYASVHAAQTTVWAVLIGRVLGLDRITLHDVGMSALLGDVGFALLPDAITQREGSMGDREVRELQLAMTRATGALLGEGRVDEGMKRYLVVAYEHHTSFVNPETGVPGEQHVLSRIAAVACAFDAMTSPRSWRPAMTQRKALEVLREGAGERFDPVVVAALGHLLTAYAGAMVFARRE